MRNGEWAKLRRPNDCQGGNSARLVFRPTEQGYFHAAVAVSPFRLRLLDSGLWLLPYAPRTVCSAHFRRSRFS